MRRRLGLAVVVALAATIGVALAWWTGQPLAAIGATTGTLALGLQARTMLFDRSNLRMSVYVGLPAGVIVLHAVNRGRRPIEIHSIAFTKRKGHFDRPLGPHPDELPARLEEKSAVQLQLSPSMIRQYWAPRDEPPAFACLVDSERAGHWIALPEDARELLATVYGAKPQA